MSSPSQSLRWVGLLGLTLTVPAGPIMLQDHGNPVQYRNIWLLPLSR